MAVVLYAGAHADDPELSMGGSIRSHLGAGSGAEHDVHVLICTTGENSGARPGDWSKAAFRDARDDEQTRAARTQGVPYHNIHIGVPGFARPADGELTVERAQELLEAMIVELDDGEGVHVKTHSNLNIPDVRHPDHVRLGQAAANLLESGRIVPNGLRFYVEPYQLVEFKREHEVTVSTEKTTNLTVSQAALREYKAQDAIGHKWGFGYKSVKSAFDTVIANPSSYFHLPT
jgi:LmbE family N-acetylglucosaminyl deacetylase